MKVILCLMVICAWFEFGIFLWRHKGKWCIATRTPQICWNVGERMDNGLHKASSTGWDKVEKFDIWCKPIFAD